MRPTARFAGSLSSVIALLLVPAYWASAASPSIDLRVNGNDSSVSATQNSTLDFSWTGSGVSGCWLTGNLVSGGGTHRVWGLSRSGSLSLSLADSSSAPAWWEDVQWLTFTLECVADGTGQAVKDSVSVVVDKNARELSVTSPAEGADVTAGKKLKIKWSSDKKEVKKIQILLVRESDGQTSYVFDGEKKNKNSYTWKVPKDTPSGEYRLWVGEAAGGIDRAGDSSEIFSILGASDSAVKTSGYSVKDGFVVVGKSGDTLEAYLDFEDPYSARWYSTTYPLLKKDYVDKGKLKIAFKNFPLEGLYPNAVARAVVARCAAEQKKGYFEMVEWFFSTGPWKYTRADFVARAKKLGMDSSEFETCYDNPGAWVAIQTEADAGAEKGFYGAPVFVIGSETVQGSAAYEIFEEAIRRN